MPTLEPLLADLLRILLFAIPVAYAAWTISREEITREARDWLMRMVGGWEWRGWRVGYKLAYLADCGFCLSPWLALALCWWLDFRAFGEGTGSLLLTALAVGWVAFGLQAWLQEIR